MDPLHLTVEVVGPDDPEYGEYLTKGINDWPAGMPFEEMKALLSTWPPRLVACVVADALRAHPLYAGKQIRVRAHR
ncbi:hypothetical protein AB0F93_00205 [Micromonospora tulbaghiae]|uniref:hypothetical protein n=1 Tax=Micromonospora tulbaghiae TaxID=479978 RepID=UPI00332043DA